MTRGAALSGALLVTLATPATWPLALGAFLIRGGIVLVALPLVVLPTPVGLGNVLGPILTSIAFGSVSGEVLIVLGSMIVVAVAWLFLGGWLAAALEAEAIRIVALDGDVAGSGRLRVNPATGRTAARVLAARLVADIPLGLVLAWGLIRLVVVTYDELTSPLDVSTPIVLRVLRGAPEVVFGIGLAWMVVEIVGAVAARRIVLADDGVGGALRFSVRFSVRSFARDPLSALASFWVPTLGLIVVLVPSALATTAAAGAVRSVLRESGEPGDPVAVLVAVLSLVLLWVVGLLLAAVVCAWRTAVWTVAAIARDGTFGGSTDRRPGDWRRDRSSGTL